MAKPEENPEDKAQNQTDTAKAKADKNPPQPIHDASPIREDRIKERSFARTDWNVIAETGTTEDNLKVPTYWAHVARQMRAFDMIEVLCEDGSWYARCLVLARGEAWAKVHVLEFTSLERHVMREGESDFEVSWGTIQTKFRVIRKKDRRVLKDGLESREAAMAWLHEHKKALAA